MTELRSGPTWTLQITPSNDPIDYTNGRTDARYDTQLLSGEKTLGTKCRIPDFYSSGFHLRSRSDDAPNRVHRTKRVDRGFPALAWRCRHDSAGSPFGA